MSLVGAVQLAYVSLAISDEFGSQFSMRMCP